MSLVPDWNTLLPEWRSRPCIDDTFCRYLTIIVRLRPWDTKICLLNEKSASHSFRNWGGGGEGAAEARTFRGGLWDQGGRGSWRHKTLFLQDTVDCNTYMFQIARHRRWGNRLRKVSNVKKTPGSRPSAWYFFLIETSILHEWVVPAAASNW